MPRRLLVALASLSNDRLPPASQPEKDRRGWHDTITRSSRRLAKRHLMMHFTRHGAYQTEEVPVISHGEGCWLYDTNGKKYFDGLSGLFCTQIGYSFGEELGEAAAKQMAELPFYTNWNYAHPRAIELAGESPSWPRATSTARSSCPAARRPTSRSSSWSSSTTSCTAHRNRYKMIARRIAYHGTTLGAPVADRASRRCKTPFEPLMPGVRHVSNTNSLPPPGRRDRGGVHGSSCWTSCAA